jgi:hypothetical protein
MLTASAGMFGIFLFLTYYLQNTLGFSPVVTGFAFLPMVVTLMVFANVSQIVLMPRTGPKPLVGFGLLVAAAGMVWLTRIGVHSSYAGGVLGPLLITAVGLGLTIAPSVNTGTFGTAPSDAGVASATVNVGQQLGGSIGTALLNTVVASATASYLAAHLNPRTVIGGHPAPALVQSSLVHGYTVGFWWTAAIFAGGAVICGLLFRRGPLARTGGGDSQPQAPPRAAAAERAAAGGRPGEASIRPGPGLAG